MSDSNTETLGVYERHIDEYIAGTPEKVSNEFREWIDNALSMLPEGSNIFEIGSSFGRDAKYIESQGHQVQRSDATKAFVELLNNEHLDAVEFNALIDEWPRGFDMIFANAVFLHFTEQELLTTLRKAHESLDDNGLLAFSLKEGQGDEWSSHKMGEPRYFKYWMPDTLRDVIDETNFSVIMLEEADENKWLHVILKKRTIKSKWPTTKGI